MNHGVIGECGGKSEVHSVAENAVDGGLMLIELGSNVGDNGTVLLAEGNVEPYAELHAEGAGFGAPNGGGQVSTRDGDLSLATAGTGNGFAEDAGFHNSGGIEELLTHNALHASAEAENNVVAVLLGNAHRGIIPLLCEGVDLAVNIGHIEHRLPPSALEAIRRQFIGTGDLVHDAEPQAIRRAVSCHATSG